jgi:uncharacterized protein (TIGR03083 family)
MGMDMTDTNDPRRAEIREVAALLALDAIDDAERAAAEGEVDAAHLDHLRHVASALADATAAPAPADLRQRVLDAARSKRAPGVPLAEPPPVGPADAFRQTVDELHRLLVELRADEWATPNLPAYGQTRDLIAHLVGVEENLLGLLGDGVPPDPETWGDHLRATSSVMGALRGAPTAVLVDRWVHGARRLAALAETVPHDQRIAVNDLPTSVQGMYVLRTFEVWTHHEDVCRATGRPLPVLDRPRRRLMSTQLMNSLPIALAVNDSERPGHTMRVVLTGLGGGTFDRAMAVHGDAGNPDVVITADVVDFCRLAARRIDPADLDATVEGDPMLAHLVLAAASTFARD